MTSLDRGWKADVDRVLTTFPNISKNFPKFVQFQGIPSTGKYLVDFPGFPGLWDENVHKPVC